MAGIRTIWARTFFNEVFSAMACVRKTEGKHNSCIFLVSKFKWWDRAFNLRYSQERSGFYPRSKYGVFHIYKESDANLFKK